MPLNVNSHDKVLRTSLFKLKASAFSIINTPSAAFRLNPNLTIDANTPNGILAGSVACVSADWEADLCNHIKYPIGLFHSHSSGVAFDQQNVLGSGVDAIYQGGGNITVYHFETHAHQSAFASILGSYTIGAPLYSSAFGLLTIEAPASHGTPGVNRIIGICCKVPTASDLTLGITLQL